MRPFVDTEAEATVIASVLLDPRQVDEIAATLSPVDFVAPAHRVIWGAMLTADGDGVPIDIVGVEQVLRRSGEWEQSTRDVLHGLADRYSNSHHARQHAASLRAMAKARVVVDTLQARLGLAGREEADAWKRDTIAAVEAHAEDVLGTRRSIAEQVESAMAEVHAEMTGETIRVRTPWQRLTARLRGGPRAGNLVCIGARPGMGKSAMGMGMAEHAAVEQRIPALVTSHEMAAEEQVIRCCSARAGVDATRVDLDSFQRLATAGQKIAASPLEIADDVTELSDVVARARAWRRRTAKHADAVRGRGIVVVDYLQLVHARDEESRQAEVAKVVRVLKQLARDLKVPVVALAQVNRGCEVRPNKRPTIADLRESGEIEAACDVILLLYRDAVYNETAPPGMAECIVGKHRGGQTGMVPLAWVGKHTAFADLESDR